MDAPHGFGEAISDRNHDADSFARIFSSLGAAYQYNASSAVSTWSIGMASVPWGGRSGVRATSGRHEAKRASA